MTAPLRRNAGVFLATTSIIAAALVAIPMAAQAAPPVGVDLSQYRLVGRYALPEAPATPAPAGSLLAQEASSVTYDWDTDTLFVVGDGGTSVVQVSKTGELIDSETLAAGSSPQGTEFYDTEAITYVGNGQFVLGEERYQQVNLFTYQAGATLTRADVKTVKLGATIGNIGIEGFAYDPSTSTASAPGFVGVKEIDPKGVFQTNIDFAAGTATNADTGGEPANLFDPALVATDDFSDVYPLSNQPSLAGTDQASDLLIISQQSGEIVDVTRDGTTRSSLAITDAGAPLSVPDETHEGITMDRDGVIYTVNENGGGDASHPQLWVYAPNPVTAPRVAVTEVDAAGSGASYAADWFELTNTGSTDIDLTGWKMDDSSNALSTAVALRGLATLPAGESAVFLENDDAAATPDSSVAAAFSTAWYGSPTPPAGFLAGFYGGSGVGLSTGGDGVNLFDAAGNHVTGVSFGAVPAGGATLDNSARLGAVAAPVTISRTSAESVFGAFTSPGQFKEVGSPDGLAPTGGGTTPPPTGGTVVVTEVAPWGSGDSPYAADWFELTNTGTTTVDLTDWKMDDSSASIGTAVAMAGVASLPAGASAVFFEDTSGTDATIEAAFAEAWFRQSTLPAGFLIGHYGGSGVGLSTGGDAVAVFDATGDLVTGVAFGGSPTAAPYATFDNTANVGSSTLPLPTISTLSAVGVNGAFLAADGAEIGSPSGAAAPDLVAPTVTFSGDKGSYGILSQISITSAATDNVGVASSTLPSAVGPAWSFGAGSHTLAASASDAAGNVGKASADFTVTVASGDLSKLTTQWVQSSAKYKSSNVIVKLVATVLVAAVSSALLAFNPKASASAKAARVSAYDAAVRSLASAGWLTSSQAATLTGLAAAL
ncbi:SdiA-regulated domain-containing protein [Gryllotalpicola protaetiae]|uniref:LTD domain-containing protein n=1 Tax=Gryllotalpicola protaetiae TaxID=2419771 RepID=A0A387BT34_9MICO|nr:lamin tail domain-containing protein [Gryllotalpicola protaetiae]AYG04219.1 hypothetical protein D7I44_12210 [Gryllotalpicola protaetiae]